MGLFDLFKGNKNKGSGTSGVEKKSSSASKWAEAAGSKRAQAYDRQEAIAELCKLRTADAAEALLKRFTFQTDPSITDQEEKDAAFEGIVTIGREAVEPIRTFASKAESLSYPIRILKEIVSEDEVVEELVKWLARWDTEYAKFIDPKLQILAALEDYEHASIRAAVEPFLQDVNEPARFHAMVATFAQKDPEAIKPLLEALLEEESVRIKTKMADSFVALGWEVPEEMRDAVRKVLPPQFGINGAGSVTKR